MYKQAGTMIVMGLYMLSCLPLADAQGHDNQHQGAAEYSSDDESGYTGEPVEVTMYHHLYNLLDKAPMNTQAMDPSAPDIDRGFGSPTLRVADQTPVSLANAQNFMYMYNSPGPVHYNVSLSQPKYHPERGLAEDIRLDSSKPITVYWYMSAEFGQFPLGASAPQKVGGQIPRLTVIATLRLGDDVGADLDAGEIIAQGTTTVDLQTQPGGPPTEIKIDMGNPKIDTIPKDISYNLKIEWFQVRDGNAEYMAKDWALHSGVAFPNRMTWTIKNPIRVNYIHPQFIGDRKLVIHAAFNSPFGNYDVDVDQANPTKLNEALKVTGPDGTEVQPKKLQGPIIVQKSWIHNHHFEPVLATWVWDYRDDGAPPGDYKVELAVKNLQGSAVAAKVGAFSVLKGGRAGDAVASSGQLIAPQSADDDAGDDGKGLPLPAPLLLVGGAGIAAAAFSRRRRS